MSYSRMKERKASKEKHGIFSCLVLGESVELIQMGKEIRNVD